MQEDIVKFRKDLLISLGFTQDTNSHLFSKIIHNNGLKLVASTSLCLWVGVNDKSFDSSSIGIGYYDVEEFKQIVFLLNKSYRD
jgi:hypothetical protein